MNSKSGNTSGTSRAELLRQFYCDTISKALEDVPTETYDHAALFLDVPANKLRDDLLKHLIKRTNKEIEVFYSTENLKEKLDQVDMAETKAWDLRAEHSKSIKTNNNTNVETVVIQTLDFQSIVDCKLRDSRSKWLNELKGYDDVALETNNKLQQTLKERKLKITEILSRIEPKISELERSAAKVNGHPTGIDNIKIEETANIAKTSEVASNVAEEDTAIKPSDREVETHKAIEIVPVGDIQIRPSSHV